MSEPKPLLLEIGTEELPPAFPASTARELEGRVRALLVDAEIAVGPARTFHTPRRVAVLFDSVAPERPGREVELQGPPRKAAFDKDGKPTKVAVGFSKAHDCTPADLYVKQTGKGEYAFLKKQEPPLGTTDLLARELPGIIAALPFPRSMRWLDDKTRFARPVRRLACLFGAEPVPFQFAGLTAGNTTLGHRGFPDPVALSGPQDYEAALAQHKVTVDPDRRRKAVVDAVTALARQSGGEPVLDPELVEETVNITESPVPILCRFDPEHLALPVPVLVTALKKHQRCFAVHRPDSDELLPHFIAVADTPGCDEALVGRWYERAVESRLRDARFFYDADVKRTLAALVPEEKRVVWIDELGSYYDKTERLRKLCARLAAMAGDVNPAALDRAAELAKADLLTDMIREKEFTSLQGRIGGVYARLEGESEAVADAIAEQYLPAGADDKLPHTRAGALLGIADKLDNIVAAFLIGAIPTGSEDPYALRRQGWGLLATILAHDLTVDLGELIAIALDLFPVEPKNTDKLPGFFRERLAALLVDRDIRYDISNAVIETDWHRPGRALAAARALLEFRERPGFEQLITGQKRVTNILRGQDVDGLPDLELYAHATEKELWQQAQDIAPRIAKLAAARDFVPAIEALLGLRPVIDKFFDDILVMDENEATRTNRLRLLLHVRSLFRQVADLSQIVIEGESA
jgi:glycyl-tRNA synthetase beta chain